MLAIRCMAFALIAAFVVGLTSAAAQDTQTFPTEISDAATYVPDVDATSETEDDEAYPTEISDPATYVPESPEATAPAEDDSYPTEISDAATYAPETGADSSSGGSSTGVGQPQTLAVQQLPNTGSGPAGDSSLPWLLFVVLAGFAGTMVITLRRAARKA